MAANDREDPCEYEDRPFQALKDQIANLSLRNDSDGESNGEAIADDGLKVVEKIESLCMNCEENVRTSDSGSLSVRLLNSGTGGNKTTSHQDPIFS
ncbi:MAG: hypothetical protein Q9214_003033, partial [Letrouitia sp. 1 TL-2023]